MFVTQNKQVDVITELYVPWSFKSQIIKPEGFSNTHLKGYLKIPRFQKD